MQLSDVFLDLGEEVFTQLIRGISIGRLKTYQLYERMKARTHLPKLNTEHLHKATPKLWQRMADRDEDFATDLSQSILVSHLDMIIEILNSLGIPHEDGFFPKGTQAATYLTDGWEQRVYEQFRGKYPEATLLFYINHLAVDIGKAEKTFLPAA